MSGIPAGAGSLLGKRLGKYEILALLALGGTAEIYLARIGGAAGFEKYVVVKCLHDHLADDPEFVKMFLDEARLAAVLDHSNIVQTFELGEHENRYYMVMEFLAGLSLAMIVRRASERLANGTIPVPLILNVAAQACAGLHYAHERTSSGKPLNMVHRDISPQNLVISFEGVVKVVDFGIARAEMRETKTKAGTIKGKFAYMSPEQCVAANVDRRTDVFALGVIVHELLTGRRLFKRGSPYETYQAVIDCAVPRPSTVNVEIDPALDDVVMKALAKDKEHRYPTAEAFGDAMLGYLHHRGKGSGPAEVGRFIDQHFGQEIEEHGERMRELISAREFSVDTGLGWGDEEEKKKKAEETVDLLNGKDGTYNLETGELVEMRPSEASLQSVVARLNTAGTAHEGDEHDDGDMPAEKTRIESNPLEDPDSVASRPTRPTATPVPPGSITNGPEPLPDPPTVALTGAKHAAAGKAPGGFPDRSNMATQIADSSGASRAGSPDLDDDLAQTVLNPVDSAGAISQVMAAAAQPSGSAQPPTVRPGQPTPSQPAASRPPVQATPQGGSPYPVMQGGRPFSSDLAPSNLPSPQRSSYASMEPSQAASVMSPVGERYPQSVDWDAAAGRRAKALPPWMLAALFGGAVLVALLVTIVLAKIFH